MLSQAIKNAVLGISGKLLRRWPGSMIARRFFAQRSAVVFYHGVWADDCPRRRLFGGMRLSDFAREMRRLKGFFEIVPLSEILSDGHRLPESKRPVLSVTFDDGLDLTGAGASDVLDELGIRATMFVNTASLAGGHLMWMHRFSAIRAGRGEQVLLREFNRVQEKHRHARPITSADEMVEATRRWPQARKDELAAQVWNASGMGYVEEFLAAHRPYMNVETLNDWRRRGHEVGFHTHTHPFCSQLDDELLEREVIGPAQQLARTLGLERVPLAYPFGDRCRAEHEKTLVESGLFSALAGTDGFSTRPVDPWRLQRVEGEDGVEREVFGKPILRSFRRTTPLARVGNPCHE